MKITPLRRCNSPRGVVDACIDDTVTADDDAAAEDAVRNILKQQKSLRLMRPYKPMRKVTTTSLRRSNNCIKSIRGNNALTSSITSSSSRNNSIKSIHFDALTLSATSSLRSDCNKLRDSINLMDFGVSQRQLDCSYKSEASGAISNSERTEDSLDADGLILGWGPIKRDEKKKDETAADIVEHTDEFCRNGDTSPQPNKESMFRRLSSNGLATGLLLRRNSSAANLRRHELRRDSTVSLTDDEETNLAAILRAEDDDNVNIAELRREIVHGMQKKKKSSWIESWTDVIDDDDVALASQQEMSEEKLILRTVMSMKVKKLGEDLFLS